MCSLPHFHNLNLPWSTRKNEKVQSFRWKRFHEILWHAFFFSVIAVGEFRKLNYIFVYSFLRIYLARLCGFRDHAKLWETTIFLYCISKVILWCQKKDRTLLHSSYVLRIRKLHFVVFPRLFPEGLPKADMPGTFFWFSLHFAYLMWYSWPWHDRKIDWKIF